MTKTICLHGPESTGKSTMATLLAAHFDCEIVPEFGRAYCEEHGTDIGMHELVVIGEQQAAMTRSARRRAGDWLVLDTDPVITAVWAEMMFGRQDPWFGQFADHADLYLLLDIDLPFVSDGLRIYRDPADRRRFFELSRAELEKRDVRWALISGRDDERFEAALRAIDDL